MRELRDWLGALTPRDGESEPLEVTQRIHRVAAASPVALDSSLIHVQPAAIELASMGTVPYQLSVMSWPDITEIVDVQRQSVLATQLGAVLTFAADRRVWVGAAEVALRMQGSESVTFLPSSLVDRELDGPMPSDLSSRVESLLRNIVGSSDTDMAAIGSAIDLHYAAVLLHPLDLNASYALAVAGVETLAQSYGSGISEWGKWDQALRFEKAFETALLNVDQIVLMKDALLHEKHLGLRQSFASYVSERLPESFWSTSVQDYSPNVTMLSDGTSSFDGLSAGELWPVERFVPKEPVELRRRLLATYDARSTFVHRGVRKVSSMTTLSAAVGTDAGATAPLDFMGVRRILRALIQREVSERMDEQELPPRSSPRSWWMKGPPRDPVAAL